MTKNQTIDLLKSQLPGFYSVEQVINLIEKIEDDSSRKITTDDIQRAIDNVISDFERNTEDIIDYTSVEFNISYDNRIEVESVGLNLDYITEALENNFMDFGEEEEQEVDADEKELQEIKRIEQDNE
jgi:transcriptional/translational regulatory protein YebC/TACO1